MSDTTAKIRAKGLENTGVTEEVATELFQKVGTHFMAIVDLQVVDRHGPNVKGKRGVEIVIDGIEPALDDTLAEHLRELTRTMYFNRQVDQPTLDDSIEPDLKTVLANGRRHEPHPFLPVDAADDNGICDVCGEIEHRPQHADRSAVSDPFTVPADEPAQGDAAEEGDLEPDDQADEEQADDEDQVATVHTLR